MKISYNITASALLAATLLTGCFTGIESTPKITYKEVEEKKAGGSSPEESLATSFVPQRFPEWQDGKSLYVTSDRIGLVLTSDTPTTHRLSEGDTIVYHRYREVPDLTGNDVAELLFTTSANPDTLSYRTNTPASKLLERVQVDVPFTIDLDLLTNIRKAIVGKDLYIKTPLWFKRNGRATDGRKFIKVTVTDVIPANEVYPYMVVFIDEKGEENAVYMSAAAGERWAPREFASLFSFSDPRINYPRITDENWQAIINSRVITGMTKSEASLALGNPRSIDRGHDQTSAYERWSYPDGVYLIFEDGILIRFNR